MSDRAAAWARWLIAGLADGAIVSALHDPARGQAWRAAARATAATA